MPQWKTLNLGSTSDYPKPQFDQFISSSSSPFICLSLSILGMVPAIGRLWVIVVVNLTSFQKTIRNIYIVSINWSIFDAYKATERLFLVHHSIMKISTVPLFPWTVFFLSCLCPLSLSFPPFLLHIYSDGPVDTVILKNAFHFRALTVFIVYVYNLAFLFIIFLF